MYFCKFLGCKKFIKGRLQRLAETFLLGNNCLCDLHSWKKKYLCLRRCFLHKYLAVFFMKLNQQQCRWNQFETLPYLLVVFVNFLPQKIQRRSVATFLLDINNHDGCKVDQLYLYLERHLHSNVYDASCVIKMHLRLRF